MDQLVEIRRLKERAEARRKKLESALAAVTGEISDLDAAERVLARLSGGQSAAPDAADDQNLTQLILDAVKAHPEGATPSQLKLFIFMNHQRDVNQNSMYGILNRHRAAERIINVDGVWKMKVNEPAPPALRPSDFSPRATFGFAPSGPDLDDDIPF